MKKLILIIISLVICVFAANADSMTKVSNLNNGYRTFSGFSFDSYKPSDIGLEQKVNAEIQKVIADDKTAERTSKYAIVGHSQGGVRALAYAKMLKEQNPEEYKRLNAVITVSGIDKGLKALNGGFSPFLSRFNEDVGILKDGVVGVISAAPVLSSIAIGAGAIALCKNADEIKAKLIEFSPILNYVGCAVAGGTENELKELYDMMPKSSFINKNVAQTEEVKYKVQTGTEKVWYWTYKKVLGIKIYYFTYRNEPVYKTMTAYKDVPLFDSNLPVGYIVGADNNTIAMSGKENEIRKGVEWSKTAFRAAQAIHIAKCIGVVGLLTGSVKFAADCDDAAKWLDDVDGQICDLLGSDDNDGLVAKESQYYPKTFYNPLTKKTENVHTKVLGDEENGYIEHKEYNHMNIDPSKNTTIQDEIKRLLKKVN
jgi:hypothetical protein